MRIQAAALIVALLAAGASAAQSATPDDLLQRGQANYRSGHYAEAITDLRAASDALLTPEQMKTYVNSGKFESLPKFETAVIYLAMSYARLSRDAEASEQIHRLNVAEAISPVYAKLPLTADVADFERVAARVAPNANLPKNVALAALPASPQPVTQVAQAQPAPADDRAAQEKIIEERVAAERAAIEKDAQQRIAAAQAEAQKTIEQRVAEERAAIQKAADERIAAERAAVMKAADEKIAAARAEMEKEAQARIAAQTQPQPEPQPASAPATPQRTDDATIRQADTLAASGDVDQANAMYRSVVDSPNASREALIAAATGLYRTGDFTGAVRGFQRVPNFLRGEEDLRYYNAVALYETGHYEQAKKELACALPYIQTTDDVARYRAKIEQTANQPSM